LSSQRRERGFAPEEKFYTVEFKGRLKDPGVKAQFEWSAVHVHTAGDRDSAKMEAGRCVNLLKASATISVTQVEEKSNKVPETSPIS
jgi:hypothetical protein